MVSFRVITFLGYVGLAFIVSYLPIINWPFSWWSGFFHELSKVISLLIINGSLLSIELSFRGTGTSALDGGNPWIVATSAYCGSVIWGILIYTMADKLDKKYAQMQAIGLSLLILVITIFWVRDIITLLILAFITILLLSIIKLRSSTIMKIAIKFIGIYIVLDAIRAPLNLLDGRVPFDLIPLIQQSSSLTYLLAFGWFIFGLLGLYVLWRWHKPVLDKKEVSEKVFKLFG